jgi:hypothetical protein
MLLKRKKSTRAKEEPFPSSSFAKRGDYHLNRAVLNLGGWSLALKHLIALLEAVVALALWYAFLYPLINSLESSMAYYLSLMLWVAAVARIVWAFAATAENKLKLLVWAGFIPSQTRKAYVSASDKPLMRNVTRIASYFLIATEVAIPIWWSTVLMLFPGYEEQFLVFYIPAMLAMMGLAFVASLHLDHMWFFRKTRLPLITAVVLGLLVMFILYRWGGQLDFWWWVPLENGY